MKDTTDAVVQLGGLALDFGRVNRITYHQDGETLESDTDHTVMLGLIACAFADMHLPGLNVGLVAQFALVHDLVEVYAGDTPTLRIDDEQQRAKAEREASALRRLAVKFDHALPWVAGMVEAYEHSQRPEKRYVRAMDKLLPKITHILNGGATLRVQGVTRSELRARYEWQADELSSYASDFPELFELRAELLEMLYEKIGALPED